MKLIEYCADFLMQITLIGNDKTVAPHKNISRTSQDYIFYLVTEGELFFCEDGIEYHLRAGDCFLFEPNKHHFGLKNSRYHLFYVHFRHQQIQSIECSEEAWKMQAKERNRKWLMNADMAQVPDRRIVIPKQFTLRDSVAFHALCELANRAVVRSQNRMESYDVLCAGLINELFVELSRQFVTECLSHSPCGTQSIYLLNRVICFLNANYAKKLNGKMLSEEFSYHFDYLNQLFRKNLGTSIFQMLEFIRIENAKILLQTTPLSLDQIADQVGYDNASYFSKVFKKRTGIPPSRYRNGG